MSELSREMLDHEWLGKALGMDFVEMTPERVVVTMPITPSHHQPFGYLHGGASVALAETVASLGASLNAPPGKLVFGLEINANHIRSRRSGLLTATGAPIHVGQTTQVWEIKIADEEGKLVCVSRCTLAVVPAEARAGT